MAIRFAQWEFDMYSIKITAALLSVLSLMSCALWSQDTPIDWQSGAKRAWIVKVYTPDTPTADLPECLAGLPKAELETKHFVKVKYWHHRLHLSAIAEVPDALKATVNDRVELWPEDCSRGKISRISRILSPPPQ